MIRNRTKPRTQWQQKMEELGFSFHSVYDTYWDESVYYSFTLQQIEVLENATNELYSMCLKAAEHVIETKRFEELGIPDYYVPFILDSWEKENPSIYGRFDLVYDGINPPKLLEFNADTPTSLFESAIVQWFWAQDFREGVDQFNSIHERLIKHWEHLKPYLNKGKLYFTCVKENEEDYLTTQYLRDCAMQAQLDTFFLYIDELGWDEEQRCFIDNHNKVIRNCFKLYPWEWMIDEDYGPNLVDNLLETKWIEPQWKIILSNKGILPILWELFPNHPLLLPAYREAGPLQGNYAKKPIFSREGANISLFLNHKEIKSNTGDYEEVPCIYQALHMLPNFSGNFPVIGSWLIGEEAAGIGIRESSGLITDNLSRFVPHIIE